MTNHFISGLVQSSIEAYLTGIPVINQSNIHPTILWIFLSLITIFMAVSRISLKNYLKKQSAFRCTTTNPQIKNTVTFKTLTYQLFLLGILSTLFHMSYENNETYILLVVNLINIVSNSFLLSYLFHNQEAVEYVKMKSDIKRISCLFRKKRISPPTDTNQSRIFVIRTPGRFPQSVKFRNDCDVLELV